MWTRSAGLLQFIGVGAKLFVRAAFAWVTVWVTVWVTNHQPPKVLLRVWVT